MQSNELILLFCSLSCLPSPRPLLHPPSLPPSFLLTSPLFFLHPLCLSFTPQIFFLHFFRLSFTPSPSPLLPPPLLHSPHRYSPSYIFLLLSISLHLFPLQFSFLLSLYFSSSSVILIPLLLHSPYHSQLYRYHHHLGSQAR